LKVRAFTLQFEQIYAVGRVAWKPLGRGLLATPLVGGCWLIGNHKYIYSSSRFDQQIYHTHYVVGSVVLSLEFIPALSTHFNFLVPFLGMRL